MKLVSGDLLRAVQLRHQTVLVHHAGLGHIRCLPAGGHFFCIREIREEQFSGFCHVVHLIAGLAVRFFDILRIGHDRRCLYSFLCRSLVSFLCGSLQNGRCRDLCGLGRYMDRFSLCFGCFLGCLLAVGYGIRKPAAADPCQGGSDLRFFFFTHAGSLGQSVSHLCFDLGCTFLLRLTGLHGFTLLSGFFFSAGSFLGRLESGLLTGCHVGFLLGPDPRCFTGSIKLSLCLPAGFLFGDPGCLSLCFCFGFSLFPGALFLFGLPARFFRCSFFF